MLNLRKVVVAALLATVVCAYALVHAGHRTRAAARTEVSAMAAPRALETDAEGQPANARTVVMFTTSHCPYCKEARSWLSARNIPYTEFDVEQNSVYLKAFRDIGGRGVPTFVINGEAHSGFEPAWILARRS